MAEIVFVYEGNHISIQCNKNQRMKDVCIKLSNKINTNLNSLLFLYGGNQLNLDKTFNEITKDNKINILVYTNDNVNEICSKCGRILNNKIIDDIILLNNSIYSTLIGLKSQIDHIINDLINKKDILLINSELKNINLIITSLDEYLKKNNNQLNQLKINNTSNIDIIEKKINNEIICIYDKQEDVINLLHDYNDNTDSWSEDIKKSYIEGKNNINENNIEMYINNKRIKFDHKYKSNEKGEIKVKFIFKKLLTSTSFMFRDCSSLKSIALSLFNTSKVNNMSYMFERCSSLKSIDLSSFNTSNVKDMSWMFSCCFSLQSLDLSSFNTSNVTNMSNIFIGCNALDKKNVKVNISEKRILEELK